MSESQGPTLSSGLNLMSYMVSASAFKPKYGVGVPMSGSHGPTLSSRPYLSSFMVSASASRLNYGVGVRAQASTGLYDAAYTTYGSVYTYMMALLNVMLC